MPRKRILIVEDEAVVALDLKCALERFGYEIPAVVATGPDAIKTTRNLLPDLVLMDVRLRGDMDGIEAARRIRATLGVPVVFLTNHVDETTLQRAVDVGPHGFLVKPFQERQLRSMIEVAGHKHTREQRLLQREDWLNTILKSIGDGVVATDAAGFVTFMNPPAERLTGRKLAASKGLALDHVLRMRTWHGSGELTLEAAISGQLGKPSRSYLMDTNEQPLPIEYTTSAIVDDRGRPGGRVVVFRDITHRLEAEAAGTFRRSEERLQALIDQGSDMIVVLETDGTIKFTSPSIENILDYRPQEAVGVNIFDLVHRDDHARAIKDLENLVAGGETDAASLYRIVRRDGSWRSIEVVAKNLVDHPLVAGIVVNARDVTDRERLAESVRLSERKYRGLFENAHDAIMLFEPEGETILELNERACAMYGFDRSELIGRSLTEISEDVGRGREYIDRILAEGVLADVRSVHIRKDGTPMTVEIQASVIEYEGEPAILTVNRDITRRIAAERSLERFTERLSILNRAWQDIATTASPEEMVQGTLRRLLNLIPYERASLLLFDHDSRRARVHATAGDDSLGTPAGEFVPLSTCVFGSPSEDRLVVQSSKPGRLLAGDKASGPFNVGDLGSVVGARLEVEGELIGELDFVSRGAPDLDDEDLESIREVAGVFAVAIHQAYLRSRLDEHQHNLQALVENLPDAVIAIDREHRITLANPAGIEFLDLLADAGPGEILSRLASRALGSLLDVSNQAAPFRITSGGSPERVFELAVATTQPGAKTLYRILVVREVTQELENRRLLQQQDRLASVGQLAAGIAHDFNNMLQAIGGFAELIRTEKDLPQDVVERAEGIGKQGRRGAQLIRQILDFSRASIIEPKPLDLGGLLQNTLEMLKRILPESVKVLTEIEDGRFQVAADPGQLQQVFTNIIVNARDAMETGGELRIALERIAFVDDDGRPFPQMGPGEWSLLSFTDSGHGIPPELLPRIYDPFVTTKEVGKGTGLGLAQVYGIVKQHGGFVDVESDVGSGTTFRIYLPANDAEIVAEPPATPTEMGRGQLVLLVEDEAPVLDAVRATLERLDYAVIPASSGGEALELFEQCRSEIDLVVSDVVMSEIGGLDLFRRLRRMDPDLPVVLMSGYPLRDRTHELEEEGGLSWIAKPFTMNQLGETISDLLHPEQQPTSHSKRPLI